VRSTNGAPFALYTGAPAQGRTLECAMPTEPPLGCGSVIHGINFDFDSAVLRPESMPILEKLAEGLADDPSSTISIEGHTSAEGSESYNQSLSERRAQAVVEDLAGRGIAAAKLRAVGHGEGLPIATNEDENGRAMNRRVEVRCAA
jgi:outer membrane protein OmpA-like peptidoglycan-associated protein